MTETETLRFPSVRHTSMGRRPFAICPKSCTKNHGSSEHLDWVADSGTIPGITFV